MIAEISVENCRDVFGGQVGYDDIYEGACVYGFVVVPGRLIDTFCEISLDCRTAGVLSMSQFRSPNSTSSDDRWVAINSHIMSRAQMGQKVVYSRRQRGETCFWKGGFLKVEAQIVWALTCII